MLKNKMKIYHIDFVCRKSCAIQFNSISKGPSEHSHFRSGREIRKVIILPIFILVDASAMILRKSLKWQIEELVATVDDYKSFSG